MTRTNGGRPQGRTPQEITTLCPWHLQGWEHPTGAPECQLTPSLERRMNLASLVHWCALALTDMAHVFGQLLAQAEQENTEESTEHTDHEDTVVEGQVITDEIQAGEE